LRPLGAGHRHPGLDRHDEPGDHRPLRLDAEKKSLSASERDEAAREAWRERAAAIEPTRWVWVDEFGSHTALTRTYARSPRGTRARGSAPRNQGPNRTTIASLTLEGLGPGLVLEGAVTTRAVEAYVEHVPAPTLRPGQIVAMDNLRQHQSARTRALIEARGAELWFLPSYSPDLNPIEEAFSKVKTLLRSAAARAHEALVGAIRAALAAISPADARGYFSPGGYGRPRPRRSPASTAGVRLWRTA
jgi:transposase